MASTTEALLLLEKMTTGEKSNLWGGILNTQLELITEAFAGTEAVTVTGGTVTLTDSQWVSNQARNAALRFTGTLTSNAEVIVPSRSKLYLARNDCTGAFTLTVKTAAGTGIVIPQASIRPLYCDGTNVLDQDPSVARQGKQTYWIPASALRPSETSGCGSLTSLQVSSGKPNLLYAPFDATAIEYAEFFIAMPKSWNNGTVTFQPIWSCNDTTTNGVAWALQAASMADNDAVDGSYGTAITVVDNNQSASYRTLIGAESAAITIAGSPGDNEFQAFRIYRDTANASDNLAVDALLMGIKLYITTNASNDE